MTDSVADWLKGVLHNLMQVDSQGEEDQLIREFRTSIFNMLEWPTPTTPLQQTTEGDV